MRILPCLLLLAAAMLDRLRLDRARLDAIAHEHGHIGRCDWLQVAIADTKTGVSVLAEAKQAHHLAGAALRHCRDVIGFAQHRVAGQRPKREWRGGFARHRPLARQAIGLDRQERHGIVRRGFIAEGTGIG